ncbi:MAG: DPP IV N-terminal domain-containing protein [Candidatus Pseudobacter hemicellulosilyticus]|uniref:DPP IV N-terminal domain-containing protein n=1 Tax=Candidatus Pseudobacter hemicellulosilyticus TaxID=3121375 RepID=A0AAJ5WXC8_9BACT|nr:MAG: DPP IV N-terminal domain-containing protein [Pseudobacter sp.]
MKKFVLPGTAWLLGIIVASSVSAQQKTFSYEQLFDGAATNISQPLPYISGWADDDNYIQQVKGADGKLVKMSVNVKTGKSVPYQPTEKFLPPAGKVEGARNPTPSPDGKLLAYTKADNNLYVREIMSGKEKQLTADGSITILNGYASWVYYEEILGRFSDYKAFWWSPNSKQLVYFRSDESAVPVFPIYVLDGQHGYLENTRYPKVGDKNPEVKIGLVTVDNGNTTWCDFNDKDDQYFGEPLWTSTGALTIQWLNRDQTDFRLYNINLSNGQKEQIYQEQQSTWVDLDMGGRIELLASGKGFILKSDKDGWQNLYLHDANGKEVNPITTGNFWSTSILLVDEKASTVYFQARKENSARFDLYKVNLNGKDLTRLTFGDYSHDQLFLSPKGTYFITTFSNLSTPPAMALLNNKGKTIRQLGSSKGAAFDQYAIAKTRLLTVRSDDGLFDLPVTITYPINFDSTKKYPVLVSIYGGPDHGSIYDRWKPATGFSQWWAQEGLVQVVFDNRASGHFGKKGMNFIHRKLGIWEIEDFMTCGRYIRAQPWADTTKIGITGGSFGGYMTCMALTYGASVFTHGIANASVTDWQFYDTHYTERFMDMPQDNAEGYKQTAVMTYADKLKGVLRIVHGTTDDNVHLQNSLTLVDKLENLGKKFELMLYPGERHSIGANSILKRKHIQAAAASFYYQYLLAKPVPVYFSGTNQ